MSMRRKHEEKRSRSNEAFKEEKAIRKERVMPSPKRGALIH